MRKLLLVSIILIAANCWAQFSKTHYIPPLTSQSENITAEDHYLYISTPSTKNVALKIMPIGGQIINATVNNNTPYTYFIGRGSDTQLLTPKTVLGKLSDKGYIIEADDLIYVSVRLNASPNQNNSYNHAGGIVSKGNSALGTTFRLGAMLNPLYDQTLLNFASILATENNTTITIELPVGTILADNSVINSPIVINLNKNESYVIALENVQNTPFNSAKIIGALVQSDKAIVVNSGSFGGSNSTALSGNENELRPEGRDLGFDQIVPFEKTGKEYIFVKGEGPDEIERVVLVAHQPQTAIYLNGNTIPSYILQPGEYAAIDGFQFINNNLYIQTTEKVFAYQCIGGLAQNPPPYNRENPRNNPIANQNMFFVPPINCATPNIVDNIPQIQFIGNTIYSGKLNIVTEKGALVLVNNSPINSTPIEITGNTNYERYTINDLSGNISVKSTKQVYVSYFGTNAAATYGGYYSGFDSKPEITSAKINVGTPACIPNLVLQVSTILNYDTFEWYFNGNPIVDPNSNLNSYSPTQPGFYQVKGSISGCGTTIFSDIIPVSNCPTDIDNDTVNDNIDLDNDNDGITNCTESYGDQNINISNINSGNIIIGNYSNSFTGSVTTSTISNPTPFTGNSDGSFISDIPAGKGNFAKYNLTFTQPISVGIEYVPTASPTDLLNANAEYSVTTDVDKTITVLNPNNQLLIDTNYDGIYESGVTEYSSFEIRFQLNGITPLPAGTGRFKFLTHLVNSISFTHKNTSETEANKTTLQFFAICVPKDSDGDGIPDQLDLDSDNDGIPDAIESQDNNFALSSTADSNRNGIFDIFESRLAPIDTDSDGVPDYLDLDSDNDGIYDAVETGSNNTDTDNDGIKNYRDFDSDNDLCYDVIEAGFLDSNGDGMLGAIAPPAVDTNGLVTSGTAYTTPNSNYITAVPILITTQPLAPPTCDLQNTSISIVANGDSYQWQLSTNGTTWSNLTNNSIYTGTSSNTLNINSVNQMMNGYQYRVFINRIGNSCGLISNETTLSILNLPVVNATTIKQCDDDLDARTTFNLTVKNNEISNNYAIETFSYFTTLAAANANDSAQKITNPLAYVANNGTTIWTRVENANACFTVAQINLVVSTTQIPANFNILFENCDDYIDVVNDDYDGISAFDFSSAQNTILALLPQPTNNYSVKYYETQADALSETNEIINTTSYRNTLSPNEQKIWVRVDNDSDNSCFGIGEHITLRVNPKPNIDINSNHLADVYVCENLPDFYVTLEAGILDGSPTTDYTYIWSKDNQVIIDQTNATLEVNIAGIYNVIVTSQYGCSRTRTITVNTSDISKITTIEVNELSNNNTILVVVEGIGNYEYSLDDPNGSYQDANLLENVPAGIHEIYVRDKNGCGVANESIAILGAPKYFTPNNDGFNDYWNIKGINTDFNSKTVIRIFDRYGKFLKDINPQGQGWDGTFNGHLLPSDDYWYTAKLENGKEIKGHFSLKR